MPKWDWMQDCKQSGIGFQTDGKTRFGFHEGHLRTEQMPSSRALFLEVSHADTRQCDLVSRASGRTKGRTDPYRRLISRRVQTRSSERFDAISFVITWPGQFTQQQEEEQRCYLNVRGPREQGAPQEGLLICHRLRDAKSLSVFLGIVFDNAEFFYATQHDTQSTHPLFSRQSCKVAEK